ncbi:phosphate regulon sensor histidine kinase PhoR [Psychromonas sp. RZ22]|uniref:phosphate regulon sensor histidine kinase PhoR n=1 Tax=Psychromonas algarum TaxID=2555643 RepID=UPI0010683C1B|nr:phosphate regulon sensor histidine kinase PhoR [Psychromonas sp. RZ22]TEW56174.1 phosphate regulon sensor histidine kinase PhoR [Psychromonas sp. RZ22]
MKVYTWKQLFWAMCLVYIPVVILGLLTGHLLEFLLVATVLHIAWHYYFLKKLNDWLWVSKSTVLPPGKSVWEHAYIGIHNMQQRYRKRHKSLANVISRFREGSEALPDAVVVFKKEGEIVWCNHLAQFQLGFKWPEDAGENITNLIRHPDFVEYLRSNSYQDPLDLISPINSEKLLEFRVMPYAKDQRLLIVRDVTSYRQMDENRRNFVANVSHELRTPLTVLQGYIEIMEMSAQDDPRQLKTVRVLEQQTARMCALVEQLMTLSKIEGAASVDFHECINTAVLLTQLENEAIALGRKKSLSINFVVDPKLSVVGDEMQLRSIMANLVYNAINYTPENGNVKVLWKRIPEGAYFCVMDTGDGIAPEHILHLTERFYRVDASRSRDTGGSGLGLSIVKHGLSHYDSELDIESNIGEGSQFSFIISKAYLC